MALEATVTSEGGVTIPKAVRKRLGIESGDTVLFRFDGTGGVRLVGVPSDPMDRLEEASERATSVDLDTVAVLERDREAWGRPR